MPQLVDVALPLPLFRTFTYALPDALAHAAAPGSRVVVPFRNTREIGIVVGEGSAEGLKAEPKAVLDAPDERPVVAGPMLALCRWIAEYYVVPLGVALRSALPVALTGAADPTPARKTRRVVTIANHLESLLRRDNVFGRAPQQRALYELVESLGGSAPVELLHEQLGFSPSVLKALVARGLVVVGDEIVARDPFATRAVAAHAAHRPTPEQAAAIAAMTSASPGETFLLHGITGSGKTLVYIETLRALVARGKTAIVLVPEIALTPQTVDRFRAVFGDQIAVLHSALSDGERYDAWLALKRGEKSVAVGARSAVFAPLENLGAIIVDEEHESSYKQGESPRYHAREVAIVRARHEGAIVVLGSATPSLESWSNAQSGKFTLLELPDRVGGASLPRVEVVDLRSAREKARDEAPRVGGIAVMPSAAEVREALVRQQAAGNGQPRAEGRGPGAAGGVAAGVDATGRRDRDLFATVISPPLETALADRIEKGEQSILLLNRRGYSSFVQCADCGDVASCPNCSISLTYHRAPERLVCHYCLHQEPPRPRCARCTGETIRQRGLGTQQVERMLAERYPAARIARMDVDTTSGKWAHAQILDRVAAGEVDILLGTQMIAKGLDFPNVTLVGVIDADIGINLPDFRASERCFQLLSQVAGRAGRGPKGGRVLIQTRVPMHHAVQCAVRHDYHGFVDEELPARHHPAYPPAVRIANVVFSATTEAAAEALAQHAAAWLKQLIASRPKGHGLSLIGPAPCPIERIKNRWRWHVLLKAEHPGELTRVSRYLLEKFDLPKKPVGLRMTLDRDPVALL